MTDAPWTDRVGGEEYPYPQARDAARAFWEEITVRSTYRNQAMMPGKVALMEWLPLELNLALAEPDLYPLPREIVRNVAGLIASVQKLVTGEERLGMAEQELISRGPDILEELESVHIEDRKLTMKTDLEHLYDEEGNLAEDVVGALRGQASRIAWLAELRHGLRGIAQALNREREARGDLPPATSR